MIMKDPLGDRQPQTAASTRYVAPSVEPVENPWQLICRDAGSIVCDAQNYPVVAGQSRKTQAPSSVRVADRVIDQVIENKQNSRSVGMNPRKRCGYIDAKVKTLLLQWHLKPTEHLLHDGREIHGFEQIEPS